MTSISHRIRYFFFFDENYTAHFPNNLTDDEPDRVLQESIESEMYFPFVDTIVGNLTIKRLGLTIIDISESTNEDPRNPVEFLLYEKNRNQIFKLAFELWMFDFRRSPSARFETPETYCQMGISDGQAPPELDFYEEKMQVDDQMFSSESEWDILEYLEKAMALKYCDPKPSSVIFSRQNAMPGEAQNIAPVSHRIRYFFSFEEIYAVSSRKELKPEELDDLLQKSTDEAYDSFVERILINLTIRGFEIIGRNLAEDARKTMEFLLYEKKRNQAVRLLFQRWTFDFRRSPSARFETPETYYQMGIGDSQALYKWEICDDSVQVDDQMFSTQWGALAYLKKALALK
ncbi:hypothetical protein [Ruminococcus sp.]